MVISLYFHIPFCTKKCDYCHFYVIPDRDEFKEQLMKGLLLEWKKQLHLLHSKKITSVYFGGGTPALLGPEKISEILDWCRPYLTPDSEITLEANPENITPDLMRGFHQAGINRISLGIQSLNDALLKKLGRTHDSQKALDGVLTTYQSGIENISVDLMYDLPGQSISIWEETLFKTLQLPITHISLYNLTIEPHTVFYKYRDQIKRSLPDPESSRLMYEKAIESFTSAGFSQYEISAFARDGKISHHNIGYWNGRPFLGFGPSAFSFWEGSRFRNCSNLSRYTRKLLEGDSPVDFKEKLDPVAASREKLAIRLRMMEGIEVSECAEFQKELKQLEIDGFVKSLNSRISLTKRGILFYDHVAVELI